MTIPTGSVSVWFGRGRGKDARLLDEWRAAPVNYSSGHSLDRFWNTDHYDVVLGKDDSGELFKRAAALVMRNRFYPSSVMECVGDFSLANRAAQTGDRVVQRIQILNILGFPILEVLTLNEITQVVDEEKRKGFTYSSTQVNSVLGEWSPSVEWHSDGTLHLRINVISRVRPEMSPRNRAFARQLQLRVHRLSLEYFGQLLNA